VRRTSAFLLLAAIAAISTGCASSDQGNATTNTNAPGTTTYSNTTAPMPTPAGQKDGASGGAVPRAAPPKASPTQPGIKPPTE
jgi:hypothetical protein